MGNTRLKKIIVISAIGLLLILWWIHRPNSIKASGSNREYKYIVEEINGSGRDPLPLIFALHGNGDKTGNFYKTLFHDLPGSARIVLIQGPIKHGSGYAWPMDEKGLREHGEEIAQIVQTLSVKYPSPQRPVLVGFSGGGYMAYYQAVAHPELYSTIIPISGGLSAAIAKDDQATTEAVVVVALHGKSDSLIGYASGKRAVDLLSDMGREAELISLPGGHLAAFTTGHDIFLNVLSNAVP